MVKAVSLTTRCKGSRRASSAKVGRKWRELFKLIPGYDPIATAGKDCAFCEETADQAVDFFPKCLSHIEGALAGEPFVLEPWQQSTIGSLFGWKRKHKRHGWIRRYREMLLFIARKNGKTPVVAGICNYVLFCDREIGAQIYSAAGERDQAALLFRHAKGMVENEPELARRARIYGGAGHRSIEYPAENSFYKVLSKDADTKHGFNPHLGVIDELHVQKNAQLVDVMRTGMASLNRVQPLLIYVTTSDWDRPDSICNEIHDYASKVRDRVIDDDTFLPVIFEADKDDDWTKLKTWKKANPNLGVSVSQEYLETECAKAQEILRLQAPFKRLHCNRRTEQDVGWLDIEKWDRCAGLRRNESPLAWRTRMLEELLGRECFVGLDLSSKVDITCAVLIFKPSEPRGRWIIIPHFWVPEERVNDVKNRDTYRPWVQQEFITATEGDEIDFQSIRSFINLASDDYVVREVGYDPWAATELSRQLREEDGFEMVEVRQGSRSLSDPMKELEAMVLARRLGHGANPVMRWMITNVAVKEDENGNVQPNKKKSTGRIDGPVATITGMARALATGEGTSAPTYYEDHEVEFV